MKMTNSQRMLAFIIYSDIHKTVKNGFDINEYVEYMANFITPIVID